MIARKLLAAALVAVAALPAVAAAEAGDDTIYFRVTDGEGCADQILYLDDEAGSPDESACGYIGGIPFDNVFGEPNVYSLVKEDRGFLMSGDEATGQITVNHGSGAAGGGDYDIQLTLKINGKVAATGSAAGITGGVGSTAIDFSLAIDPAFAGVRVSSMSVDVLMGGVFLNSGYMAAGDASFITLPRK